jgi:hypothetical protein
VTDSLRAIRTRRPCFVPGDSLVLAKRHVRTGA